MSDPSDGSGPIPRRSPRAGDGGAPVTGALAIVLAVVAVVAGFLILRSISSDDSAIGTSPGAGGSTEDPTDTTVDPTASTVPSQVTTTTQAPLVTTGASVIVVNANGVGGSAGQMARAIETVAGFDVVDPTDASSTVGVLEDSVIYFVGTNPQAQAVAESLNVVLGGDVSVAPLEGTAPTADGTTGGADVVLMLGTDKEGQTLEELNPDLATPSVTNPPVAGDTTTSTTSG